MSEGGCRATRARNTQARVASNHKESFGGAGWLGEKELEGDAYDANLLPAMKVDMSEPKLEK